MDGKAKVNFLCNFSGQSPIPSIFPSLTEKVNCTTRRLVSSNNLGIPGIKIFAEVLSLGKALMVFQG